MKNRRAYFDDYAKRHGFDPLIPENWYSLGSLNVFKEKKVNIILFIKRLHRKSNSQ